MVLKNSLEFLFQILQAPSDLVQSGLAKTSIFGWSFRTWQQELWRGSYNSKEKKVIKMLISRLKINVMAGVWLKSPRLKFEVENSGDEM